MKLREDYLCIRDKLFPFFTFDELTVGHYITIRKDTYRQVKSNLINKLEAGNKKFINC